MRYTLVMTRVKIEYMLFATMLLCLLYTSDAADE